MKNKVFSLLGLSMKAGCLNAGELAAESAAKGGDAKLVILAQDASPNTSKKFINTTNYYQVPLVRFASKSELGKSVGKEEISVIALCNEGFAKKIMDILENSMME